MTVYHVQVRRSLVCTVEVEAGSPAEAIKKVDNQDFDLPPRDEWDGQKDWQYEVYDANGDNVEDL